jgi:hypothetical protein
VSSNALKPWQGFRKGRSTVSAARVLQHEIAKAMDNNNYVAVASLDLSSAFDIVNINLMLTLLITMGLPQDVVELLHEWLVGRFPIRGSGRVMLRII